MVDVAERPVGRSHDRRSDERHARHSMFERRRHALVAGLVLLGVAAAADRGRRGRSERLRRCKRVDDRWLAWMIDIRTPWLTRVAEVLSVLGGPLVMVPLRLTVIAALAWRRRWLQLGAFLGATVTSELCIGPLKALIDRPRPPGALISPTRRRSRPGTRSPRPSRPSGSSSCSCRRPAGGRAGRSSPPSSPP